jgi:squalene cyclase
MFEDITIDYQYVPDIDIFPCKNLDLVYYLQICEKWVYYRYVECTSAAIQGLALFTQQYPHHRRTEIEICITKAADYIESIQLADGSWLALLY